MKSIQVIARFFVSFYSRWGCVDQYIVVLLFLWFPCSILSLLRGTERGLFVNRKSPPWFVPSIFSPSSVGPLWSIVVLGGSFFEIFPDQGGLTLGHPFRYVFLVDISVASLSWMDGNFLKTRIRVYHQGQHFSSLIFSWLLLWVNRGVFPP